MVFYIVSPKSLFLTCTNIKVLLFGPSSLLFAASSMILFMHASFLLFCLQIDHAALSFFLPSIVVVIIIIIISIL